MWLFVLRRTISIIPLVLFLATLAFLLVHLMPGDAVETILGDDSLAREEQVQALRAELGLDRPFHIQYVEYIGGVARGDLGNSLFGGRPVLDAVLARFPATLSLTLAATAIALFIGLVAGVLGAIRPGSWIDRLSALGASLGLAIPNFWLALVLISFLALTFSIFPATGYVRLTESPLLWAQSITLPAIALGTSKAAIIARQTRSAVADSLASDYVRTARAKGVGGRSVVWKHALKNAAIPVLTVLGLTVTSLLGGAIIVERVFAIPGLGDLAVSAVNRRDMPIIQGIVLFTGVVVLLTNLLVDIAYAMVNPRVRPS